MIDFKNFISEHFPQYRLPEVIKPGVFFRFGKNLSAWGILFDDCSGGAVGDWRSGDRFVWQSSKSKRTPYEREQFAMHLSKIKAAEDVKRELAYLSAAKSCEELFEAARKAPDDHPYLVKKRVKSHGLKISEGSLLVPVYSVMGDMQSIQRIDKYGYKRFHPGGKTKGGCHMIGMIEPDHPIAICEGYATGASIFEDGVKFVVVAFNSGNLIHVANGLREQLPTHPITIFGDDDWQTPGNPGKTAAIEAAKAVGGKYILPDFGQNRKPEWTDFNDFICNGGL